MNKTCIGCTKCCEGWLSGNIHGYDMSPGVPCHFVEKGVGCTIYTNRPDTPCVQFSCEWVTEEGVPDFMRPASSGVVMVRKELQGHQYLFITVTDGPFDENIMSWAIMYGVKKYRNVMWQLHSKELCFVGTHEFMELAGQ